MRIGLPLKIALIFSLLAGVGIIGVTYTSYFNASNLLKKQSLESLSNDLKRENAILESGLNALREEALFLSQLPAISGIIRAHNGDGYDDQENLSETSWVRRLGEVFQTVMEQRTPYTQMRFIGKPNNGRELVRINRAKGSAIIVDKKSLQEKGNADYFKKSLMLSAGEVYYSRVNYNREHGKIAFPLQPVLRVGVPVFTDTGNVFGVLVINVDFQQLASPLYQPQSQANYYLTNEQGDYIIHPNKDKQLSFEFGEANKIQNDFPIDINKIALEKESFSASYIPGLEVGLAVHRLYFDPINPQRYFLISSAISHEVILTESLGLAKKLTYVVIIAVFLLSILAAISSRLLTRRLVGLKEAADRVASGDENIEILVSGHDEIGDLSRSFKNMLSRLATSRSELRELTASLENKVSERTAELESSNSKLLEAIRVAEESTSRLEETLQESETLRNEAEQANIAKSDFLANMSHELRTPLNGIIGMTHFTLESKLTPEQYQQLKTIDSSAKTLLSLLNDILDVSKVEAGKLELETTTFDLEELIDQTVELHAITAYSKGIELIFSIEDNVPTSLLGDPERLQQVMVNLLGNALKFTDEGEIELKIALDAKCDKTATLHFSVRDTGIGIPKEKHAAVFERFTQADNSTTRKYGGTGLGITISKQIVELMNGHMWLESEAGKGSIFHFTITIKTPPHNSSKINLSKILKGLKILIVENNTCQQTVLCQTVAAWGLQSQAVTNGSDALQILNEAHMQKNDFDICLLNFQLPFKNGIEIATEIRDNNALDPLKIVLLTHPGDWVGREFNKLHIDAQISKPVKKPLLLSGLLKSIGEAIDTPTHEPIIITPDPNTPSLNILIAEDNEVNQQVAKLALSRLNHNTTLAINGVEALKLWRSGNYDLILMDVQMPEMDGLTATQTIRSEEGENEHIPIIAATAHAMASDKEKCIKAGMDGYITKPINLEQLKATISTLVNQGVSSETYNLQEQGNKLYDLNSLRELTQGDEEQLKTLVQVFIANLKNNLETLKEAITDEDFAKIESIAHKIKGSSSQFGANSMNKISGELEIIGKNNGNIKQANKLFDTLLETFQAVKFELDNEVF